MRKPCIYNCHSHTFTADHVPPFIAKTFVPRPLHVFLPLSPIVAFFRIWYQYIVPLKYTAKYKYFEKKYTETMALFNRIYPINVIAGYYVFFYTFFCLYRYIKPVFPPDETYISRLINNVYVFSSKIFPALPYKWMDILLIIVVLLFLGTIRNLLFAACKLLWKVLSKLPGTQTREMIARYLNIGRYAFHKEQKTIFSKLKGQYPNDTHFIVLPMDMDYMAAGNSNIRYRDQMKELLEVKEMPSNRDRMHPFIFADPRRFVDVKNERRSVKGDKQYFSWQIEDSKVVLKDCFMKDFIETHGFRGIKIYPALGYYPFDEKLLPLWRYAVENDIPIMTHCIKGTIFFRGIKKNCWNMHPLFMQTSKVGKIAEQDDETNSDEGKDRLHHEAEGTKYEKMILPQFKNMEFSVNFTHPMNYLCLLEEPLLRCIVAEAYKKDKNTILKDLFGYSDINTKLTNDLSNLKICLGHFGGDDQWERYFEKDRYNHSNQLSKHPTTGINFFSSENLLENGKLEQLWKYTDWYSIICSMIMKYPNVYADISYILHDEHIQPLLKQTLQNKDLKDKVLYGTDFFVVRNHKSDKNMLSDMMGGLSETEFDLIARQNPINYLRNSQIQKVE